MLDTDPPQQVSTRHEPVRVPLPSLFPLNEVGRYMHVSDVEHLFHQDKDWQPTQPKVRMGGYQSQIDPNLSSFWSRKKELRELARQATHCRRVLHDDMKKRRLPPVLPDPQLPSTSKYVTGKMELPLITCPGVRIEEICSLRAIYMPPVDLGRPELDCRWLDVSWVHRAECEKRSVYDMSFDLNLAQFDDSVGDSVPTYTHLLNSPRSILVLFRSGTAVIDILRRSDEYLWKLAGTKRDAETIKALRQHSEARRHEILENLRTDYTALSSICPKNSLLRAIIQETPLESEEDEREKSQKMLERKDSLNSKIFVTRVNKETEQMQRLEELQKEYFKRIMEQTRKSYTQQLSVEKSLMQRTEERAKEVKNKGDIKRAYMEDKRAGVQRHWEEKHRETEETRASLEAADQERTALVKERRVKLKERLQERMRIATEKSRESRCKVEQSKERKRLEVEKALTENEINAQERRAQIESERLQGIDNKHEKVQQRLDYLQQVHEAHEARHELLVQQQQALQERINKFVSMRDDDMCLASQNLRRHSTCARTVDPHSEDGRQKTQRMERLQNAALRYEEIQAERRAKLDLIAQQDRIDGVSRLEVRERNLNKITFAKLCAKATDLVKKDLITKKGESNKRLVRRTRDLRVRMLMSHEQFLQEQEKDLVTFRKKVYREFLCKKDNVPLQERKTQSSLL